MPSLTLVGGTGSLGAEVSKGLATAAGYDQFVALVRPSAAADKTQFLTDQGWTVKPVDFDNAEALTAALADTRTVVSTMSGAQMLETEIKVMNAAKAAGVAVFAPSQFGIDTNRWSNFHPFLDMKVKAVEHAESIGLNTLIVMSGGFSDQFLDFTTNVRSRGDGEVVKATLVDGGVTRYSFTKRSDIGRVLAKALADPQYAKGGRLSMHAETMEYKDAVALLEKALGEPIEITKVSLEDSQAQEAAALQKFVETGDTGAFYESFVAHMLNRAAAGDNGFDVSAESNTYGLELESVETTFQAVYGKK